MQYRKYIKKNAFFILVVLILLVIGSALCRGQLHQATSRKSSTPNQQQGSQDRGNYSNFSDHYYFPASGRPGNGKED